MLEFIRPLLFILLLILMVLFQAFAGQYLLAVKLMDLPLLSLLYLTLIRERLLWPVVLGTSLGLWQDSLSLCPLGMNGLVKLAAIGLTFVANSYFDINRFNTRWLLLFACSVFSSLALGSLRILFLNRDEMVNGQVVLLSGLLNATLGLLFFYLFDKVIKREE